MINFKESRIFLITFLLGVTYFIFSIGLTICDFSTMRRHEWSHAENQSTVYSSRRSTAVTYNFVKDNIRISRKYPGILEGLNTWMWNIDKNISHVDISFYVRNSDYHKILNKEIVYRKDLFGEKLKELVSLPFFGLRTIKADSSKTLLFLDIWKFNYSILFAFLIFVLPYFLVFSFEKLPKMNIEKDRNMISEMKIGGRLIFLFIILIINLLV